MGGSSALSKDYTVECQELHLEEHCLPRKQKAWVVPRSYSDTMLNYRFPRKQKV